MSSNKITVNDSERFEVSDAVCDAILNVCGKNSKGYLGSGIKFSVPPCLECNFFYGECQQSAGQQLYCINNKFESFKGKRKESTHSPKDTNETGFTSHNK